MKRIVILCLIAIGVCAGSAVAAENTIKIGVLYNLTGPMAVIDQPGFHGMELAQDVINSEGGVLGKKISLIVSDCRSNLDATADAASTLAGEKGIVAVSGLNDTDYAIAAAPAVTTKNMVFLTSGATMQNLPYMYGKYFFMTAFGDNMQARAVAKFAKRRLNTTRCFVGTNISSEFAKTLSKYFKRRYQKYGGKVVKEDWFNTGDATYPLPKEGDNPDLFFLSTIPPDVAKYVTEVRAAGFEQPIASGDGFDTPGLLNIPQEYAHSIYFATHVAFDNPAPEVQDFVERYEKMFGVTPESGFAALGYDSVMLLAKAITKAGSTDPEAIRASLAETKEFRGVTGEISYPEGVRVPDKSVDIVRFSNGTVSFVEQIAPN
ncbi:ABC transporter substrate-binding protein [Desulfovibrio gilichinskyi]|uniref:Amino acid/amide ABC transporter substrate-binding protein, HAAT family n=1 Tax=Desulfovibrio gilichinskyi TaxID=1519643 RepID=A0A1X7DGR8_9BACT|nr:ABC transporter substrate-binding protein [Desulfovibrio gilichinskyi]SMF15364.1 amino acid/amide ABC transporter substrate-binding protein, HAAT family [Desulfovibrio gilichinskyi]